VASTSRALCINWLRGQCDGHAYSEGDEHRKRKFHGVLLVRVLV